MYPNPADVLPLPARPNLEQYKKRAKALVKACTSGERDMIRRWAADWIESLASALNMRDSGSQPPLSAIVASRSLSEFV